MQLGRDFNSCRKRSGKEDDHPELLAILLFSWYTLLTDPQTFTILVVAVILAWVVEAIWRRISRRELKASEVES